MIQPQHITKTRYLARPHMIGSMTPIRISRQCPIQCEYCGKTEVTLIIEHVMPQSRGGEDDLDNLVPSCISCNNTKRDKFIRDWKYPFDVLTDPRPFFLRGPMCFWSYINTSGATITERVNVIRICRPFRVDRFYARVRLDTGQLEEMPITELHPIDTDIFERMFYEAQAEEFNTCVQSIRQNVTTNLEGAQEALEIMLGRKLSANLADQFTQLIGLHEQLSNELEDMDFPAFAEYVAAQEGATQ